MFLIWYQLCCLMKFARKELLHTFPPQVTNAQPIHVNECLRDQWDGFASIVGLQVSSARWNLVCSISEWLSLTPCLTTILPGTYLGSKQFCRMKPCPNLGRTCMLQKKERKSSSCTTNIELDLPVYHQNYHLKMWFAENNQNIMRYLHIDRYIPFELHP